jgi:hypothetical protein
MVNRVLERPEQLHYPFMVQGEREERVERGKKKIE